MSRFFKNILYAVFLFTITPNMLFSTPSKSTYVIHDYQMRNLVKTNPSSFPSFEAYQEELSHLFTMIKDNEDPYNAKITISQFNKMRSLAENLRRALANKEVTPLSLNNLTSDFKNTLQTIFTPVVTTESPNNYQSVEQENEAAACKNEKGSISLQCTLESNAEGTIALDKLIQELSFVMFEAMDPTTFINHLNDLDNNYHPRNGTYPPSLEKLFKPRWFTVLTLKNSTDNSATIEITINPYAEYKDPVPEINEITESLEKTSIGSHSSNTISPSNNTTTTNFSTQPATPSVAAGPTSLQEQSLPTMSPSESTTPGTTPSASTIPPQKTTPPGSNQSSKPSSRDVSPKQTPGTTPPVSTIPPQKTTPLGSNQSSKPSSRDASPKQIPSTTPPKQDSLQDLSNLLADPDQLTNRLNQLSTSDQDQPSDDAPQLSSNSPDQSNANSSTAALQQTETNSSANSDLPASPPDTKPKKEKKFFGLI